MILSSLAAVVLSASAFSPLSHLVHLHPKAAQPNTRISVTLVNQASSFRDVKIDGRVYTIHSHGTLTIKAPAGTPIFADSRTSEYRRGDLMLEVGATGNDRVMLR